MEQLLSSTDIPLVTAFLLGIIVAVNPCQLAINTSALTYIINKDALIKDKWANPLLYTLGRSISYVLMAWAMICLIGGGKNIRAVQSFLEKGEEVLPYTLIVMAAFFLYRGIHIHRHEHGEDCHNCGQIIKRNGPLGALSLGMALALAFCPESAVFYFGVLIPLSATSSAGLFLPIAFAAGAALPVVCIAFVMHKARERARNVSHSFGHFQRFLNVATAVIFLAIAVIMLMGS